MQDTNFGSPLRMLSSTLVKELELRYYNSDIHKAAFVLPQFAKEVKCVSTISLKKQHCQYEFVNFLQEQTSCKSRAKVHLKNYRVCG